MLEPHSVAHLDDEVLIDHLAALVASERQVTAAVLIHLAEVDARKLYLGKACASMHVYCVRELHLSEAAAFKRITAARAARRFPALFTAIAAGQLHLTAVVCLAPHLTEENAAGLIAAATHQPKSGIDRLLARLQPRPDVPAALGPVPEQAAFAGELAPGRVDEPETPRPTVTPLSPRRFALQLTMDEPTHDKLLRAQALLRHRVPSGDLADVLGHALDALLAALARAKFAQTERPRRGKPASGRQVPRAVRRGARARR